MKYIDSHAHYLARQFNKDRSELLNKLFNEDLSAIIECGTNTASNDKIIKFIKENKDVYGVIGYFPTDVHELEDEKTLEHFKSILSDPKILGIGEIGFDYHHKSDRSLQRKWFMTQLKLAKTYNLPVCIHSRDAEADTLSVLKNNGKTTGVIHCYSYGVSTMHELDKLGFYFGVGSTCTYLCNKDLRDAIKQMPIEKIVLETDAPYLSPVQKKKERNDSNNIKYVINELAKLKNTTPETIIAQTNKNVHSLYARLP